MDLNRSLKITYYRNMPDFLSEDFRDIVQSDGKLAKLCYNYRTILLNINSVSNSIKFDNQRYWSSYAYLNSRERWILINRNDLRHHQLQQLTYELFNTKKQILKRIGKLTKIRWHRINKRFSKDFQKWEKLLESIDLEP